MHNCLPADSTLIFKLSTLIFSLSIVNHPVLDPDDAVAHFGEVFVVGDDYKRVLELVAEVEEEAVEFVAVFGIEVARRLVRKNH